MVVYLVAALVLVAIGGGLYLQYQAKQRRIALLRALAARLGFEFSIPDPGDLLALPFALFDRGDGRGVENVMWGDHAGRPTRLFDYWYYEETRDAQGHRSKSYHRFTCGMLTIDATCANLRLAHEGFFSKIGNAIGIHDLELEFEDFNREFRVHCDDQRFAFSILDGRMMEWLMRTGSFDALETGGTYVLVAQGRLDPPKWPGIIDWLTEFHTQIPAVVFSTYGTGAP